jgi:hypothetical protein
MIKNPLSSIVKHLSSSHNLTPGKHLSVARECAIYVEGYCHEEIDQAL